jgi:hypothetical protein
MSKFEITDFRKCRKCNKIDGSYEEDDGTDSGVAWVSKWGIAHLEWAQYERQNATSIRTLFTLGMPVTLCGYPVNDMQRIFFINPEDVKDKTKWYEGWFELEFLTQEQGRTWDYAPWVKSDSARKELER